MFEKGIIEFLKKNPEKLIELLKKNPNFGKYKTIYEHYCKDPEAFKSASIGLEMFLTDHIEGLICSSFDRDPKELKSEGFLLNHELRNLKLLN